MRLRSYCKKCGFPSHKLASHYPRYCELCNSAYERGVCESKQRQELATTKRMKQQ